MASAPPLNETENGISKSGSHPHGTLASTALCKDNMKVPDTKLSFVCSRLHLLMRRDHRVCSARPEC